MRPVITVTSPVLNENLLVGAGKNITWSVNGSTRINPVKVQWSKDGGAFTTLAQNVPAANQSYTGHYS